MLEADRNDNHLSKVYLVTILTLYSVSQGKC